MTFNSFLPHVDVALRAASYTWVMPLILSLPHHNTRAITPVHHLDLLRKHLSLLLFLFSAVLVDRYLHVRLEVLSLSLCWLMLIRRLLHLVGVRGCRASIALVVMWLLYGALVGLTCGHLPVGLGIGGAGHGTMQVLLLVLVVYQVVEGVDGGV